MATRLPLVLVNGQLQQLQSGDSIAASNPAAVGTYTPGSFSIADGTYAIMAKRLTVNAGQRLTVAGTGRLVVI